VKVKVLFPKCLFLLKLAPQNDKRAVGSLPTALLSESINKKTVKPLMKRATVCLFQYVAGGSKPGRHTSSV
jgi:hypothetical protein